MPQTPPLDALRQLVSSEFAALGDTASTPIDERIVIRGGLYCGRTFQRSGLTAVWFAEEGEVKFFSRPGELAHVVSLRELESARRAA